ncbi:MAG: NAD(P)H-hydrate dehydratase [Bacteroidaceae bacterium]|nr:NAD(P)H-hydrate dehydratase [Bacteroidaceae bacterium]
MKLKIVDIKVADMRELWRPRPADGHKGTFGHALLVAGSKGMAGAAVLAAEACLRSGIGKLSVQTPDDNRIILQISVPEAILGSQSPDLYDAVGIGPGIGIDSELVRLYLTSVKRPMVLDADALNVLAQDADLQALIPPHSILTPHPGEAGRLIGSSQLDEVARYAQERQVFIVLKGHPTHVCMPDGTIIRMPVGNSGMATAGSGDVLTGLITGLVAQGYTPREAALLGVWLHGAAGDAAAREMGEASMLARDIIRHLPDAFNELKSKK